MKHKKLLTALAILLVVCLAAGVSAVIASPSYGTESDPLVTKSYMDTVKSDVLGKLNTAIANAENDLMNKFASSGNANGTLFISVSLPEGKTLSCQAGTEILLRSGSAVSVASSSAGLTDSTDGVSLTSSGKALSVNHLYMAQAAGAGVKSSSGTVTLLVRGAYTVA